MTTLAIVGSGGPRLADPATPLIRAEDLGLLRGESVFETTRVIGGAPVDLDRHLERLGRSADVVGVPLPTVAQFTAAATLAVRAWREPDGVLRLVATKGGDGVTPVRFALVTPLPADVTGLRRRGISAVTLPLGVPAALRKEAPWLLGGVKATSYAVPMAGQRAAATRDAEDAIWISADDQVLEGTTSAVLVVTDGIACTPPAADVGILPSLTLARAREVLDVIERPITATELAAAQEVLLVSSIRGAVPIVRLDGVDRPIGPVGRHLPGALEEHLRAVAVAARPMSEAHPEFR